MKYIVEGDRSAEAQSGKLLNTMKYIVEGDRAAEAQSEKFYTMKYIVEAKVKKHKVVSF